VCVRDVSLERRQRGLGLYLGFWDCWCVVLFYESGTRV
jgi:hypothetical protein